MLRYYLWRSNKLAKLQKNTEHSAEWYRSLFDALFYCGAETKITILNEQGYSFIFRCFAFLFCNLCLQNQTKNTYRITHMKSSGQ